MRYYIIAGEASGDLHGSNLMKGIYTEDPNAEIRFWGGDLMESVWHQSEVAGRGVRNRATPLAAGGGAHVVGGVVLSTMFPTTIPKLGDDSVLDDQISILDAFHMIHLRTFQPPDLRRQNSRQRPDIIYNGLHSIL